MKEQEPDSITAQPGDVVSLLRGLRVLEAIVDEGGATSTPRDIADATGIDRSIVQRVLRTLVGAAYVERLGRGDYGVGPAMFSLGLRAIRGSAFVEIAEPYLQRLNELTGEPVTLAILANADIVYQARVAPARLMSENVAVGSRLPGYCTAIGRVILAFLPAERSRNLLEESDRQQRTPRTLTTLADLEAELGKVRKRGYSIVDQELELGLRGVAAPVFDGTHTVIAGINIAFSVHRSIRSVHTELVPPLVETANELSRALGWKG